MIEIVSHVYAGPLKQYATMMRFQISSLLLYPALNDLIHYRAFVADRENDPATWEVIDMMEPLLAASINCYATFTILPLGELFRRAIGRHRACCELGDRVNIVWFTDVDYVFGEGCIEAIAMNTIDDKMPELSYPEYYYINNDHETGDRLCSEAEAQENGLLKVDKKDFARRRGRAIGGQFIVRADVARRGYVGTKKLKWLATVDPDDGFHQCRCDVQFKATMKEQDRTWEAIPLPNVMRIRHTRDGRAYRIDGTTIPGAK